MLQFQYCIFLHLSPNPREEEEKWVDDEEEGGGGGRWEVSTKRKNVHMFGV